MEREPFNHWFISQLATIARGGPSQKPGTPPGSPLWMAGTQALGTSTGTFPRTLAGRWIRGGAAETQT